MSAGEPPLAGAGAGRSVLDAPPGSGGTSPAYRLNPLMKSEPALLAASDSVSRKSRAPSA